MSKNYDPKFVANFYKSVKITSKNKRIEKQILEIL